jgi:hypothetical protein
VGNRTIPEDLLRYLRSGAPLEREVRSPALRACLWPEGEIAALNESYHVHEFAPDLLAFGSDGGGEMLAFDRFGRVLMLPFILMDESEAVVMADSWHAFERAMLDV